MRYFSTQLTKDSSRWCTLLRQMAASALSAAGMRSNDLKDATGDQIPDLGQARLFAATGIIVPFPTKLATTGMAHDNAAADPWRDILVLALDGGGTRGYASLLMLQELMNQIAFIEENGMDLSCEDGESFEPHHSSFGRNDGDSMLVSKSGGAEPISNSQQALDPHVDRGFSFHQRFTQPLGRTRRNTRRSQTRQELLFEKSKYLPCHYFDYIGGTSTGGLAALMLGRLRMSADECIDRYPEMAESIFGNKMHMTLGGLARNRYDATNLENVIKDIVLERLPEEEETEGSPNHQLASPEDLCKTVVVAKKDHKLDGPHLFRSYATNENDRHPHNPGPADTCKIWEAGRATSAAPSYFKSIKIDGHKYYDGGVGYNDPTEELYKDVLMRSDCDSRDHMPIALILTLGTGTEPTLKQKAKGLVGILKARIKEHRSVDRLIKIYRRVVKETATNTMGVVKRMRERADRRGFKYFKWDGGEEVGALGLDNCKKEAFTKMKSGIHKYMEDKSVEIREAAELLVRKRRARFEDQDRWQSCY
ncbi:hypothetical protein LA080_000763 [Diaporthe eres]|nr:hypothetical protein LA080_000763 [Diaporthe eres]